MAGTEALGYDPVNDEYLCPNGRRLRGEEVRRLDALAEKRRQEFQDEIDAGRAYDPYNHRGKHSGVLWR